MRTTPNTCRASVSLLVLGALTALSACSGDDATGPSSIEAQAGPDQSVATGVTVTLEGSAGSGSGGGSLAYAWTQVSGPAVTLSNPTASRPTFRTPRRLATLRFTLVVSTPDTSSAPDTVLVSIDRFTRTSIASDVASANSDYGMPGPLGAAPIGPDFLVVSCRTVGTPAGLFGTVLDSSGAVLRTVPISSHGCSYPHPSVASDGAGVLVVFQRDGGIVAARLSPPPALTFIGEAVISTGASNFAPSVAAGGGGYLAVWQSFRSLTGHDIYGSRLDGSGASPGEQAMFVQAGEQIEPAIAFDGVNFLVIWRDTRSGAGPASDTDIWGTRISAAGGVLDVPGFPISTAAEYQGEPQLAFDGANFLAVWSDARRYPLQLQPPTDIFGTRISPAGTLLDGSASAGGIPILTADVSPAINAYPGVGVDGANFLVAIDLVGFAPPAGIYLARVSPTGTLLDRAASALGPAVGSANSGYSRVVFPTIASSGPRILVAWLDNIELGGEFKDIVGVVMDL